MKYRFAKITPLVAIISLLPIAGARAQDNPPAPPVLPAPPSATQSATLDTARHTPVDLSRPTKPCGHSWML